MSKLINWWIVIIGDRLNSLVCLKSLNLQDDSFLVQPCCGVLEGLGLPLTALVISFGVQFYRSAGVPENRQ